MALDITKVRLILRTHLLSAVPTLPALQQWENNNFEAPDPESKNWIREQMEPTTERLVATNTIANTGNYRVDVVVPNGLGTEGLEAISNDIVAAFPPGLSLTDVPPTCTVQVRQAQRRQARRDTRDRVWYFQPVIVSWIVYTNNP